MIIPLPIFFLNLGYVVLIISTLLYIAYMDDLPFSNILDGIIRPILIIYSIILFIVDFGTLFSYLKFLSCVK